MLGWKFITLNSGSLSMTLYVSLYQKLSSLFLDDDVQLPENLRIALIFLHSYIPVTTNWLKLYEVFLMIEKYT